MIIEQMLGEKTKVNQNEISLHSNYIMRSMPMLPNLFSTTAHFLWTAHQTAHCIYGTYFIYKTYIV